MTKRSIIDVYKTIGAVSDCLYFDPYKGATFTYDELGYPKQISIPAVRGSITYTYSARGEKLQVNYSWQPNLGLNPIENVGKPSVPYARLTRDYVGNKVYEDKVLKKILLPNGYIENNIYYFYLRDHLGNNMVTAQAGGTEIQRLLYHPYGSVIESLSTGIATQPYKFGGKEEENMHGVGLLDFENRSLNFLGAPVFTTPDPLAHLRPWESVYLAMGGNPVRFTDPTGMIIEDPNEIYKEHKEQIENNLSAVREALQMEGMSDEVKSAFGKLESSYQATLNEYSTLEKSEQVYNIFNSGEDGGSISFDKGTVMIGVSNTSTGLLGHELKHAYQYEKGQISFSLDGGFGSLYDISDETEAYNRERMLAKGMQFFMNSNYKWNNSDVRKFGESMTPPACGGLSDGPINLGKKLRNSTIDAGFKGIPVTDAYKGYQKDFDKGWKRRKK